MQSLDGLIARSQSDKLEWGGLEDKNFLDSKLSQFSVIIVGRKTYESSNKSVFARHLTYIYTRSPRRYHTTKGKIFTKLSPRLLIRDLKRNRHTNIAILAGGEVAHLFLKDRMIDDMYITLAPKIFGKGVSGFGPTRKNIDLVLKDVSKLGSSRVLLYYGVR